MASPFVGAWETHQNGWKGIFLFSETHCCALAVKDDRPPFKDPKHPTDAEKIAAYDTMSAGGGSYSYTDATMTLPGEYDRIPGGGTAVYDYTLRGDRLTLKSRQTGQTWVFVRDPEQGGPSATV